MQILVIGVMYFNQANVNPRFISGGKAGAFLIGYLQIFCHFYLQYIFYNDIFILGLFQMKKKTILKESPDFQLYLKSLNILMGLFFSISYSI